MATKTWNTAKSEALASLGVAYHQEVERLAAELRPRFESGELRGFRSGDGENGAPSPFSELEKIVEAHFGLKVREETRPDGWTWFLADDATTHAILAVSPSLDGTSEEGCLHDAYHATDAATWDVLTVARRQGYYRPTADEEPHPRHLDSGCPFCAAS